MISSDFLQLSAKSISVIETQLAWNAILAQID